MATRGERLRGNELQFELAALFAWGGAGRPVCPRLRARMQRNVRGTRTASAMRLIGIFITIHSTL